MVSTIHNFMFPEKMFEESKVSEESKVYEESSEQTVKWDDLPQELSREVLSYLEPEDLARFSCVSRTCRKDASADCLWEDFFPEVERPDGMSLRTYIIRHGVGSGNQLIQRVEDFVNKVQVNQGGVYECHFPLNNNYKCRIEIELDGFFIRDSIVRREIFLKKMDAGYVREIQTSAMFLPSRVDGILSLKLPENTAREVKNIVDNRVERIEKKKKLIELAVFSTRRRVGVPYNLMKRLFDLREDQEAGALKKIGRKAVVYVGGNCIGLFSLAEGYTSFALGALASTARLYSKENQLGQMLFERGLDAFMTTAAMLTGAFVQLGD